MRPAEHNTDNPARAPSRRRRGWLKRAWTRIRQPLANSALTTWLLPNAIAAYLRFTRRTNPFVTGSGDPVTGFDAHAPAILALWHGQHIMIPALNQYSHEVVGLFSKSADAELNARVAAALGLGIIRGSGGRVGVNARSKGGARALLALRNALSQGKSVAMIADVSKATPREAGLGIVTLARISGRPIIGAAYATSRRYVIERSWDKTTFSLPFGRAALVITDPVLVPGDADDDVLEQKRREVTDRLNAATDKAYRMVDAAK